MRTNNSCEIRAADLMPDDTKSLQILRARAAILLKEADILDHKQYVNYIRFIPCNNEYYGICYDCVQEVIRYNSATNVPFASNDVLGVIYYRGMIVSVIDLMKFFKVETSIYSVKKYIIVINHNGLIFGIAVEQIVESSRYPKYAFANKSHYSSLIDSKNILGIHDGITTILDMNHIASVLKNHSGTI